MAEKVPIYPVEGTIWDTIRAYEVHHHKQAEMIQRATLGLGADESFPAAPQDMPYPRMVYHVDYFSEPDESSRSKHYKTVQSEQDMSKASSEGFIPYGEAHYQHWEKEKSRKEKEKREKEQKEKEQRK
jgi:hypothetical protein